MIKPYSIPFTLWQIDALLTGLELRPWIEEDFKNWALAHNEEIQYGAWRYYNGGADENQDNA